MPTEAETPEESEPEVPEAETEEGDDEDEENGDDSEDGVVAPGSTDPDKDRTNDPEAPESEEVDPLTYWTDNRDRLADAAAAALAREGADSDNFKQRLARLRSAFNDVVKAEGWDKETIQKERQYLNDRINDMEEKYQQEARAALITERRERRQRFVKAFKAAGAALVSGEAFRKVRNYYNDEEKGRRRKIATVVAAVVGAGALLLLANHDGSEKTSGREHPTTTSTTGHGGANTTSTTVPRGGGNNGHGGNGRGGTPNTVPAPSNSTESFRVESGHGYTQEIRDAFPGHTPQEYLQAHNLMLQQYGPDYIQGVGHYTMQNGQLGLSSTGEAHFAPGVADSLKSILG
jgi:hypothetical protein